MAKPSHAFQADRNRFALGEYALRKEGKSLAYWMIVWIAAKRMRGMTRWMMMAAVKVAVKQQSEQVHLVHMRTSKCRAGWCRVWCVHVRGLSATSAPSDRFIAIGTAMYPTYPVSGIRDMRGSRALRLWFRDSFRCVARPNPNRRYLACFVLLSLAP